MRMRGILSAALLLVVCATLAASLASAEVVVFDQYNTTATIGNGNIHILRTVRIRNVGETPIIPGELHFRLYQNQGGTKVPIPVTNLTAKAATGTALGTTIATRDGETDLSVQVWDPLLPGFSYTFTMEYNLDFHPSGVLFYELQLPQEETTIPITHETTTFKLADGYHVTYAPGGAVSSASGNTVVQWDKTNQERVVEYSWVPFPELGIRAVNVFWLIIIVALVAVFVLSVRRQRKRSRRPPRHGGGPYQQYQQPYGQHWQQQPRQPPHGGQG